MAAKRKKRSRAAQQKQNRSPVARSAPAPHAVPPAAAGPAGVRRADIAHLSLLLAALALAYLLPFELLVLSYAVLGPLHYLTEISWLHDRQYYLPHRGVALALSLVALGAMFMADPFWLGVVVCGSFAVCAILATTRTRATVLLTLAIAAGGFAVLWKLGAPFALAWALLPTLIHVSVFTLVFMIGGAVKSKSPAQFVLVGAYLLAIAAIVLLPPSHVAAVSPLGKIGQSYFGDVAPALGAVFGAPHLKYDGRVAGLLSFVYTYHYLNWFIKADVIRWAAVPRARLAGIGALSLAATGLYFYNYVYGFMVLLLLSLIHVLLEFPLNALSFRQLGSAISDGVTRRPSARPSMTPT